jgi:hypothetical protein
MLSLSLDELDASARRHVTKYGLSWPQAVIGLKSSVRADYHVEGVPRHVVISPDGKIVSLSGNEEEIRATVEEISE